MRNLGRSVFCAVRTESKLTPFQTKMWSECLSINQLTISILPAYNFPREPKLMILIDIEAAFVMRLKNHLARCGM